MAKYNIAEMFGMIPDMVMQGHADPESILSIAETGQPNISDPYTEFLADDTGLFNASIYDSVLESTGDQMLANMAASGNASDALVNAMMTDTAPTPEQLRLEQAMTSLVPLLGVDDETDSKVISEYSNSYGIDEDILRKEIDRVKREEEVVSKTWWQEDDGVPIDSGDYEPFTTIINPRAALDEILNTPVDVTNTANSTAELIAQDQAKSRTAEIVPPSEFDYDQAELKYGNPIGNMSLEDIANFWKNMGMYGAFPDFKGYQKGTGSEEKEAEKTDEIVSDIQDLTDTDASTGVIKDTDPQNITNADISKSGYMVGTVLNPEDESNQYASVMDAMLTGKYQYIDDQKQPDGSTITQVYIDPVDQNVYTFNNQTREIQRIDKLQLDKNVSDTSRLYEIHGNYFLLDQHEGHRPLYSRYSQVSDVDPNSYYLQNIDPFADKTPKEKWDIIRAQQLGNEAYNPVAWGARGYGFRPAYGQFLLSGGFTPEGTQSLPFQEWLPKVSTESGIARDASGDYERLVSASRMGYDPSKWGEGTRESLGTKEAAQRATIMSLMQGDAARADTLHMTGTALGATEGYTSNALRGHLGRLYDVYEAQQAAEGKPVGSFVAWLDDRIKKQPSTGE